MKPKTVVFLVILAIVLIVLFQNTTVITLRFLFWEASLSQAVVGILLLAIGLATGYILAKIPKRSKGGARAIGTELPDGARDEP